MMNKTQLKSYFHKGYLDEVALELLKYGKVIRQHEFEIDKGYYAGTNSDITIEHKNTVWNLEFLNGNLRSLGFKH